MKNTTSDQTNHAELLNEILASASNLTIENRFVSTTDFSDEAPCNGRCGSGVCRSFV